MSKVQLNRKVPAFSAAATGGQTIKLSDFKGKNLVIYFYPRDNTPGCTTEGQDFRDHYSTFKRNKTVILGVSRDSLESHEKFRAKQDFPFELLSDDDEKLCTLFDVIREKNIRPQGHEYRTQHLPDRRKRKTPAGMAQGQGQGACGSCARSSSRTVITGVTRSSHDPARRFNQTTLHS